MDGFGVARAMRADAQLKDVFIVALTGWGAEQDRARTAAAGFDAHLTKAHRAGCAAGSSCKLRFKSALAQPKFYIKEAAALYVRANIAINTIAIKLAFDLAGSLQGSPILLMRRYRAGQALHGF
jgi:hypothetical protein